MNRQGGHASPRDGVDQPPWRFGAFEVLAPKPRAAQQLLKDDTEAASGAIPGTFRKPGRTLSAYIMVWNRCLIRVS
jgi:hypothetical protein